MGGAFPTCCCSGGCEVATYTYAKIREGFPPFRVPTGQKTKQRYLKKSVNFQYRSESNPSARLGDQGDDQCDWVCYWEIHRLSGQVTIDNSDSGATAHSPSAEARARFVYSIFFNNDAFFLGDLARPAGTYRILVADTFGLADGYVTFDYTYTDGCVTRIAINFEGDDGKLRFDLTIELSEPYDDTGYIGDLIGLARIDDDFYALIKAAAGFSANIIYYNRESAYPNGDHRVLSPTTLPQMVSVEHPLLIEKTRLSFDMRDSFLTGITDTTFCPPFSRIAPLDYRDYTNEPDFNLTVVVDYRFSTQIPICVSTGRFNQDNDYLGTTCEAVQIVGGKRIWRTATPTPVDDSHTNFYGHYGFYFGAPPDYVQVSGFPYFRAPSSPIGTDTCSLPPP